MVSAPLFSSLDLFLLSSCSGNQFILTHEPVSEFWDSLYLSIPFSPHPPAWAQKLSEGILKSPMFLSSEFWDLQFLHYKGKRYIPSHPSYPKEIRWRQVIWVLILSYPYCYLPSSTSAFKACDDTQTTRITWRSLWGHGGKLQAFYPNTHIYSHSSPSPSLCCPFSLSLPPSIQYDINGVVH